MIQHTMIVSFDSDIPETELHQYLKDIENLMMGSGRVERFSARQHIRVPGDDHSPLCVATVIAQLDLADLDALNAVFALPGIMEINKRWQPRYPYKVVWANHEAL
ncbi:hypothetical protein [Streptomyces formicae]|uniref:Stress-response A/B barrel domain-containing protein n=1 Tax=Streptomyces formicae TaxID=1616117 RepID=A0A291QLB4_9ACTN|nr:hypothetical protein [Streptomyces formicae]ATL32327.1 hypothetical protein KY5_7309 [Streptomyces formicae]